MSLQICKREGMSSLWRENVCLTIFSVQESSNQPPSLSCLSLWACRSDISTCMIVYEKWLLPLLMLRQNACKLGDSFMFIAETRKSSCTCYCSAHTMTATPPLPTALLPAWPQLGLYLPPPAASLQADPGGGCRSTDEHPCLAELPSSATKECHFMLRPLPEMISLECSTAIWMERESLLRVWDCIASAL